MSDRQGNLLGHPHHANGAVAPAYLVAGLIGTAFVFSMAATLPGELSYDSVVQLLEGRTAAYSGWHPPVMSWLLGLADMVVPGALLFTIADALLLFGATVSLLWLVPRPKWVAVPVALFCLLTPQLLIYQGIVWKDVLFANAAVAGFVALAHAGHRWHRRRTRLALIALSFLLLALATLARQNGVLVLVLGAIGLGWIAHRSGWSPGQASLWAAGALIVSGAVVLCASWAFDHRVVPGRGVSKQVRTLELYDLSGALAADPSLALPDLARTQPHLLQLMRTDGARLYSPVRSDTLANSRALQSALADAPDDALHASWKSLVLAQPALYLRERLGVFRWTLFTPDIAVCVPYVTGLRAPADLLDRLHIRPRDDWRDDAVDRYGQIFAGTPVFSHLTFLLLGAAELWFLLSRRNAADIAFACMFAAAVVFSASFLVVSIACDYRYLYVLDLSAIVTLLYITLDPRLKRSPS